MAGIRAVSGGPRTVPVPPPKGPIHTGGVTGLWGRPLLENGGGVPLERPGMSHVQPVLGDAGADMSLIRGLPGARAA